MKSTTNKPLACDALWNERQAHISMQQDAEKNKQDDLRAMNKKTIKEESRPQAVGKHAVLAQHERNHFCHSLCGYRYLHINPFCEVGHETA